jgi:hypothetical protein
MRRNPARVCIEGYARRLARKPVTERRPSHDGRASSLKLSTRSLMFFEAAACCWVSEPGPIATTPRRLEELLRRAAQAASSSTDLRVSRGRALANAGAEPQGRRAARQLDRRDRFHVPGRPKLVSPSATQRSLGAPTAARSDRRQAVASCGDLERSKAVVSDAVAGGLHDAYCSHGDLVAAPLVERWRTAGAGASYGFSSAPLRIRRRLRRFGIAQGGW